VLSSELVIMPYIEFLSKKHKRVMMSSELLILCYTVNNIYSLSKETQSLVKLSEMLRKRYIMKNVL
jgi:hypothetical protein